jgi:hypothetical protein
VKRERMLQVALGLLGLLYVGLIYPLYTDLAHSKWLLEMKDACEPMFLSWFIALGPFLLLAARKPSLHRSLIVFAACQSLVHASVMTIQTVEAWNHGVRRDFTDVVITGLIGGILLALTLDGGAEAERTRYPITADTSLFHSRPRPWVVPWDCRQTRN